MEISFLSQNESFGGYFHCPQSHRKALSRWELAYVYSGMCLYPCILLLIYEFPLNNELKSVSVNICLSRIWPRKASSTWLLYLFDMSFGSLSISLLCVTCKCSMYSLSFPFPGAGISHSSKSVDSFQYLDKSFATELQCQKSSSHCHCQVAAPKLFQYAELWNNHNTHTHIYFYSCLYFQKSTGPLKQFTFKYKYTGFTRHNP